MAKSPEEALITMVQNLKNTTGKSLEEWLAVTKTFGFEKHGQIVKQLKTEHSLTHGYANLIAHKTLQSDAASISENTDLTDSQYTGDKAGLRPIFDELKRRINQFGDDVEWAPKKAYVSLRRRKQFALIQPSTKTRVDVGINLKDTDPTERLEASGSFNAMCSHRVRVTDLEQVDDQLIDWLKQAYDLAG